MVRFTNELQYIDSVSEQVVNDVKIGMIITSAW